MVKQCSFTSEKNSDDFLQNIELDYESFKCKSNDGYKFIATSINEYFALLVTCNNISLDISYVPIWDKKALKEWQIFKEREGI